LILMGEIKWNLSLDAPADRVEILWCWLVDRRKVADKELSR
jgi:hypothetical protein